jgi:hypothetical protein
MRATAEIPYVVKQVATYVQVPTNHQHQHQQHHQHQHHQSTTNTNTNSTPPPPPQPTHNSARRRLTYHRARTRRARIYRNTHEPQWYARPPAHILSYQWYPRQAPSTKHRAIEQTVKKNARCVNAAYPPIRKWSTYGRAAASTVSRLEFACRAPATSHQTIPRTTRHPVGTNTKYLTAGGS